jgi:hypothetical protein
MATRTWVSGVGDDANPCSRTAPCKTFAGAISKTAAGGEIDVIDPGGFGAVSITKGMTIDGGEGGGFASILAAGTNGIIINAGTQDVTIRNVSINGAGTGIAGIRILSAKTVFIENCEIFSFRSISGTDAGIGIRDARTAGGNLFVTGCTIRNNLITGILSLPASGTVRLNLVVDNCWIQGNGAGGGGIVVAQGTHANISNSSITGNGNVGVAVHQLGGGVTECNIENCVIAHNVTGILCAAGTQTVRLSHTTVIGNTTGISIASGTVASFGSNRITGNGSGNAVSPGAILPLS